MIINEMLDNEVNAKIFGNVLYKLPKEAGMQLDELSTSYSNELYFVHAVGMKLSGNCTAFDKPIFLILPSKGVESNDCSFEGYNEWKIKKDMALVSFEGKTGTIDTLWDPIKYYKYDASITVRARKINSTRVRVEYEILFEGKRRDNRNWDDLVKLSDYKNLDIGAEHEFSVGIASIKLEVNLEEACVSLYALGRRWAKECVTF